MSLVTKAQVNTVIDSAPNLNYPPGKSKRSIQYLVLFALLISPLKVFADHEDDLFLAIEQQDVQQVSVALKKGANANARIKLSENCGDNCRYYEAFRGNTALRLAMLLGNREIISMLVKAEADINAKQDDKGRTLLMYLALARQDEKIRLAKSIGADVHAKDANDRTALHHARGAETVRLLVELGADVEAKDKNGDTPLLFQIDGRHPADRVRTLIELKAGIHVQSKSDGQTPLIRATRRRDLLVTELLLRAGAKTQTRDNGGHTALEHAEKELQQVLKRDNGRTNSEDYRSLSKIIDSLKAFNGTK